MQIEIGQTKKGAFIELNGEIYSIVDWNHLKPGKGGAYVRTKLKNIKSEAVVDKTSRPTEKVEVVHIEKKNMQYLYSAHDTYEFMDTDTYEQVPLHRDQLGEVINYLKENLEVTALVHKNQIVTLEPPIFIDLKIVSTEPGIRGDTSRSGTKPAKTESGMTVLVPLFINEGDIVRIDTRTGEYVSRV